MFRYLKIPYFTCTFFTKFIYNECIEPYFLSHVVLKFSVVNPPSIMCIIGAPNQTQTPIPPSQNYIVQFIKFTYGHDGFPEQARTHKHTKYDPLITTLQNNGWKTNHLIAITVGVRGAIHENSIEQLIDLKVPKTYTKTLMINIHQNAIKYLT